MRSGVFVALANISNHLVVNDAIYNRKLKVQFMPHLSCNGIELYYEIDGQGPALLLLAGIASDSSSWKPLLFSLRQRHTVITVDSRGTGRTTPDDAPSSRDLMVADIIALLDSLELQQCALFGHSMGAMLAWAVAEKIPARTTALIAASADYASNPARVELFRTLASIRKQTSEADWYSLLYHFLFTDNILCNPEQILEVTKSTCNYSYKQSITALDQQIKALESFQNHQGFTEIDYPVLAFTGEYDVLFPITAMDKAYAKLPNVQTHVISDAAHSVHWENTRAVVTLVNEFLSSNVRP